MGGGGNPCEIATHLDSVFLSQPPPLCLWYDSLQSISSELILSPPPQPSPPPCQCLSSCCFLCLIIISFSLWLSSSFSISSLSFNLRPLPLLSPPAGLYYIELSERVVVGKDGNLYFAHLTRQDSRNDYTCNVQYLAIRTILAKEPITLTVNPCKFHFFFLKPR